MAFYVTVRNYTSYTDAELRRAANASDGDIDATLECARRFIGQRETPELPQNTGDAKAGYPECDFLADIARQLRGLAEDSKGVLRTRVEDILAALLEVEQNVALSVEYGTEELKRIDSALLEYHENS